MEDPLGVLVRPVAALLGRPASPSLNGGSVGSPASGSSSPTANGSLAGYPGLRPQQNQQPQAQQQQPAGVPPASRAHAFRAVLAPDVIDLPALRALAYDGVPDDERGLRAAVWRLLLGLLPPERAQWERVLRRKRAEYAQFCEVG